MNAKMFRQNPDLVTRTIDGEAVIMHPRQGKVLALNEVGTLIWEMADGEHTVEETIAAILREFEVTEETALNDLDEFVGLLREKDLILPD